MRILAALLLAALLVIGIQQWRVSHYKAQTVTLQSAVVTFESAQKANLATIVALEAANDDWAGKCAANEPQARHEAELSAQADAKRQASAQKSIKSLQATYEREPTAKAWADTRVPDIAVRMLTSAGKD
jgi:hypothetical protein